MIIFSIFCVITSRSRFINTFLLFGCIFFLFYIYWFFFLLYHILFRIRSLFMIPVSLGWLTISSSICSFRWSSWWASWRRFSSFPYMTILYTTFTSWSGVISSVILSSSFVFFSCSITFSFGFIWWRSASTITMSSTWSFSLLWMVSSSSFIFLPLLN